MLPVTAITANATQDDLSDAQYIEIAEENAGGKSWRKFAEFIGSAYSHTSWQNWTSGTKSMPRAAKNELRRLLGMAELVPTVADALADVDPDAEIFDVGNGGTVCRVLKLRNRDAMTIYVNGAVSALATTVTWPTEDSNGISSDEFQPDKPKRKKHPVDIRRQALRAACRAHGLTLEDAAANWLEQLR